MYRLKIIFGLVEAAAALLWGGLLLIPLLIVTVVFGFDPWQEDGVAVVITALVYTALFFAWEAVRRHFGLAVRPGVRHA